MAKTKRAKKKNPAPEETAPDAPEGVTENTDAPAEAPETTPEAPPASPAPKEKGELQKISTGGNTSFKAGIVLNGVKKEYECKDGVIATKDPLLAEHLRQVYSAPPKKYGR